jgi:hypothetical protein
VADGVFAEVDEADWLRVRRDYSEQWGLSGPGKSGHRYVVVQREPGRDRTIAVARAILCPGEGQNVSYRDGSTLNLRRENLYVRAGHARLAVPPGGYRKGTEWGEVFG